MKFYYSKTKNKNCTFIYIHYRNKPMYIEKWHTLYTYVTARYQHEGWNSSYDGYLLVKLKINQLYWRRLHDLRLSPNNIFEVKSNTTSVASSTETFEYWLSLRCFLLVFLTCSDHLTSHPVLDRYLNDSIHYIIFHVKCEIQMVVITLSNKDL